MNHTFLNKPANQNAASILAAFGQTATSTVAKNREIKKAEEGKSEGEHWVTVHGKHIKLKDGKIEQGNIGQHKEGQEGHEKGKKKNLSEMTSEDHMKEADHHREMMKKYNKEGEGHKYHYHMGKRDMHKELAASKKGKEKHGKHKEGKSEEKVGVEKNNWNKKQAEAYANGASNEEIAKLGDKKEDKHKDKKK
jgi:hypothetical protein